MADYIANTWQDRVTVGGNRFTDQTGKAYTFTPAPEQVVTEGTPFSAAWMNHIESGIGSGGLELFTCTTTGTVHALTGGALNNLKFVADAAFEDGDTFTVNGVTVTAQTQDGEPLPGGFFAAGAVVTAFLNGTTLNFKSGGAALNFKVVGGTTQPENPSENTIWLNTAAEITSWEFSSTEPTVASEGLVWIKTGAASAAPFNALKKNVLSVYVLGCLQYEGGAWAKKTATIYQNGAWQSFLLYLLDGADLCLLNGGTWSGTDWSITGGTGWSKTAPRYTDEGIVINNPSSTNNVKYSVTGKQGAVDMTVYDTLTLVYDITVKTTDLLIFAVTSSKMNIYTGSTAARIILGSGQAVGSYTQTIDVSELNGEYYFAFGLLRQGAITLKEVYLT